MQNSPEQEFIAGVKEAIEHWYNGCPKSMVFVKKIIDLHKEYEKQIENK